MLYCLFLLTSLTLSRVVFSAVVAWSLLICPFSKSLFCNSWLQHMCVVLRVFESVSFFSLIMTCFILSFCYAILFFFVFILPISENTYALSMPPSLLCYLLLSITFHSQSHSQSHSLIWSLPQTKIEKLYWYPNNFIQVMINFMYAPFNNHIQ